MAPIIEEYRDKVILAPMVRIGTLPMRLLAKEYGADITYTEELIDKKLIQLKRVENETLGTVDFVDKDGKYVLRTCEAEREHVVLQIGTGDAVTALKAAEMYCRDVAAIDINMGCPKHFSTAGDMGSKLLSKPDTIHDILTTLKRNLPCPVTCKIRLLECERATVDLARMIESCGVPAMGLHGRFIPQRPREPAHWDRMKTVCSALHIPVIGNGDIFKHSDIARMKADTGCSSVMIARGAQWNASIFRPAGWLPLREVKQSYTRYSILTGNHVSNSKYALKEMLIAPNWFEGQEKGVGGLVGEEGAKVHAAKSMQTLAEVYGQEEYLARVTAEQEGRRFMDLRTRKRPAAAMGAGVAALAGGGREGVAAAAGGPAGGAAGGEAGGTAGGAMAGAEDDAPGGDVKRPAA